MGLMARKLGALFGSIFLLLPFYVLLHEGGHALVALLCGARVTEFSLLGAHMSYEGGAFTPLTLSLLLSPGPPCCWRAASGWPGRDR